MTVVENRVDAMPVRIKPEPQESLVPRSAPQPPPPPLANTSNGAVSSRRHPPAHQNGGPGSASRPGSSAVPSTSAASSAPGTNSVGKEKETAATLPEDAIDYDSVRGVFGWATLDGTNVPYIIRKFRKFVAVRIVEKKMLSRYPNSFPDELGKKDPLISYFVTEAEARLLNEINTVHCSYEYGQQPFSTKDLIVDLTEFEEFFKIVKKTFPDDVLATMNTEDSQSGSVDDKAAELSKVCGWMQINNTVTPYIVRSSGKFVPLSVILYAAQLLTKDHVEGHLPTEQECRMLNSTCQAAGFDFTFGKSTRLIHISEVVRRCRVRIFELPFQNPLQHAQYIDALQQGGISGGQPPPPLGGGMPGNMVLPYQSKPVQSEGPPNYSMFSSYNPFVSMANMMSQASSSAPRPNSLQTATSVAMSSQTQLVRTQNTPIFFPPAPPSSTSRSSHVSNTPTLPQPSSGHQRQSPSGMVPSRISPSSQAGSPHTRLGSPPALPSSNAPVSQAPGIPPQFMRGGPGMQGRFPYPGMSAAPPLGIPPHLLPPYIPPHPHMMQKPPMSGPPGQGSHPYMPQPPPHLAGQQNDMMVPGVGPVPRGSVPMMGYPPLPGMPGGLPHRMRVPHPSELPPRQRHPGPFPPQPGLPSQPQPSQPQQQPISRPQSQPSMQQEVPRSSPAAVGHASTNSHPVVPPPSSALPNPPVAPSQPSVFPVKLSPAAPKSDIAQQGQSAMRRADEHLKLVADIKAVMSHGKSISCMRRDSPERKGNFCLVEAVAKLYFPKCSLSEFVNALQNVLRINLHVCTETEAKAFIHFYNLPVTSLNDNHMITLEDLNNYFPQISYMFRHASADSSSMHTGKPLVMMNTSRKSTGTEGTKRLASPSAPITIVLNNNDNAEVISIDSDPPTPVDSNSAVASKRVGGEIDGSASKVKRRVSTPAADEVDGSNASGKKTDVHSSSSRTSVPKPTASQVIVID